MNARDGALKDFALLVQQIDLGVLEQVAWLLWELVGRNNFSTFVFLTLVSGLYFIILMLYNMVKS